MHCAAGGRCLVSSGSAVRLIRQRQDLHQIATATGAGPAHVRWEHTGVALYQIQPHHSDHRLCQLSVQVYYKQGKTAVSLHKRLTPISWNSALSLSHSPTTISFFLSLQANHLFISVANSIHQYTCTQTPRGTLSYVFLTFFRLLMPIKFASSLGILSEQKLITRNSISSNSTFTKHQQS